MFQYTDFPTDFTLFPTLGPSKGNTLIKLKTQYLLERENLFCFIDEIPIQGTLLSSGEYACLTPSHFPTESLPFGYGPSINANIPLNLTYKYYVDIRLKTVSPRWVPMIGGT